MEKHLNTPVGNASVTNRNHVVPPVPSTSKTPAIPEAAKKLKKEDNGSVVGGVITGAATGVGALVGAVAGSFAANAINKHNATTDPDDVVVTEVTDSQEEAEVVVVDEIPAQAMEQPVQHPVRPQSTVVTVEVEEPVATDEPAIEVIGYEHINTEDGTEMDLVVLSVDGAEVGVVDVDMDGRADVMLADVNGDGVIDENEIVSLEDVDIAMVDLMNAMPQSEPNGFQYAQADQDYNNNANVDSFFA